MGVLYRSSKRLFQIVPNLLKIKRFMRFTSGKYNYATMCISLLLLFFVLLCTGCQTSQQIEPESADDAIVEDTTPEVESELEPNPIWILSYQIAGSIIDRQEKSIALEMIAEDLSSSGYFDFAYKVAESIDDAYYKAHSLLNISRYVILNEMIPSYLMSRQAVYEIIENGIEEGRDMWIIRMDVEEAVNDLHNPIAGSEFDPVFRSLEESLLLIEEVNDPFKKAALLISAADSYKLLGEREISNQVRSNAKEIFNNVKDTLDLAGTDGDSSIDIMNAIEDSINPVINAADSDDYDMAFTAVKELDSPSSVAVALSYIATCHSYEEFEINDILLGHLQDIAKSYSISTDQLVFDQ